MTTQRADLRGLVDEIDRYLLGPMTMRDDLRATGLLLRAKSALSAPGEPVVIFREQSHGNGISSQSVELLDASLELEDGTPLYAHAHAEGGVDIITIWVGVEQRQKPTGQKLWHYPTVDFANEHFAKAWLAESPKDRRLVYVQFPIVRSAPVPVPAAERGDDANIEIAAAVLTGKRPALTPPAEKGETKYAILFDDADVKPEVFTGDGARDAALARFAALRLNWECYLFSTAPAIDTARGVAGESAREQEFLYAALGLIVDRIEACGASPALTHASTLACDLRTAIGNKWNKPQKGYEDRVRGAITNEK